jgi:hypothetical protein
MIKTFKDMLNQYDTETVKNILNSIEYFKQTNFYKEIVDGIYCQDGEIFVYTYKKDSLNLKNYSSKDTDEISHNILKKFGTSIAFYDVSEFLNNFDWETEEDAQEILKDLIKVP